MTQKLTEAIAAVSALRKEVLNKNSHLEEYCDEILQYLADQEGGFICESCHEYSEMWHSGDEDICTCKDCYMTGRILDTFKDFSERVKGSGWIEKEDSRVAEGRI